MKIYGSFALMLAALLYIDAGRLLMPVWCCAALHELGHWIPLRLFGGRVAYWELSARGLSMGADPARVLSYSAEIFCTLAGPLASFLCALFFMRSNGIIAWSGICVAQGAFNLLPAEGLDGGRALNLALRWLGLPHAGKITRTVTVVTALAFAAGGSAACVLWGYSPVLLAVVACAAISMLGSVKDD